MRGIAYLMAFPPVGPALLALAILFLAGCQQTTSAPVEKIVFQAPVVPASTLRCAAQPVPGPTETEADVESYTVALAAAGQDCRTKLGTVRGILETRP